MNYIDKIQVSGTEYVAGLPNMNINSKGNLNLVTSAELGNTSKGKINIESMDDIQIKPGDDVIFYSHHRPEGSQDEVSVKFTDGDDIPVKLQVNAAEMTLTTKDKAGTDADVMNITVNSAKNTRGYLKVRAQAIDLRSESHGGIALQPKGYDNKGASKYEGDPTITPTDISSHNVRYMNKVKFEHGGGDGLEFGTFNTLKSSLFTNEYRFNRDGIVKMATRQTTDSNKFDEEDITTKYKYVKQNDDFYDIIDPEDEQTTWHDIIKTAYSLNRRVNGTKAVETSITSNHNLEIATKAYNGDGAYSAGTYESDVKQWIQVVCSSEDDQLSETQINTIYTQLMNNGRYDIEGGSIRIANITVLTKSAMCVAMYSEEDIATVMVKLTTASAEELEGYLFTTEHGLHVMQYDADWMRDGSAELDSYIGTSKISPNINVESCNDVKIKAKGNIQLIANNQTVTVEDLVKLVNYMKANNAGPWAQS